MPVEFYRPPKKRCIICKKILSNYGRIYRILRGFLKCTGFEPSPDEKYIHEKCFDKNFIFRDQKGFRASYSRYTCSACVKTITDCRVAYVPSGSHEGLYHEQCFDKYWMPKRKRGR